MQEVNAFKMQIEFNDLHSLIIENIDVGIRVIDKDLNILFINEGASRLFEVDADRLINSNISTDVELTLIFADMLKCLKTGRKVLGKTSLRSSKNGEINYYLSTIIPINVDSQVLGCIEYTKDIRSLGNLYDYLKNPFNTNPKPAAAENNSDFEPNDDFQTVEQNVIEIIDKVNRIASMDYNVLIYGETGTGKEIISRMIHRNSPRNEGPFIAQNCAAIPENLLESMLFGTEVGGFTGALDKKGLFELANNGTLLLDELNSLPTYLQAKLLRVLEDNKIRRVGGSKEVAVNTRVICTTNEKPELLIKDKILREDLFYRLGPMYISIPPLRDRKSDIDYLTRLFLKRESKRLNLTEPVIDVQAKKFLREYHWPGNVRELKNTVNGILMNSPNLTKIGVSDIPDHIRNCNRFVEDDDLLDSEADYVNRLEEFEKRIIKRALATTNGNISEAAKILGIKRQTLQYKIKKVIK